MEKRASWLIVVRMLRGLTDIVVRMLRDFTDIVVRMLRDFTDIVVRMLRGLTDIVGGFVGWWDVLADIGFEWFTALLSKLQ